GPGGGEPARPARAAGPAEIPRDERAAAEIAARGAPVPRPGDRQGGGGAVHGDVRQGAQRQRPPRGAGEGHRTDRRAAPGAPPPKVNHELIYDWNDGGDAPRRPAHRIEFDDETLRDGLQSPSVVTPTVDQRLEILRLMDAMGIDTADIGLPRSEEHTSELQSPDHLV